MDRNCARSCLSWAPFLCFPVPAHPQHVFRFWPPAQWRAPNGATIVTLSPDATNLSVSLKVKTSHYHAPNGICHGSIQSGLGTYILPDPGKFCLHWNIAPPPPPSGCLEETDCITRSTEELKSHRMNLYQWNRVDGKELAYKWIFLHLTICSKVQRFRMTSLESFHVAT